VGVGLDLKDKVCLVTGGTSGIGWASALALSRKGAQIAIASRHGSAHLTDSLRSQILKYAPTTRFLQADVADPADCRKCVEQVAEEFGRLDVLVHSAGGPAPGSLQVVTDETWMNAFAVHVHSVFHLSRAAAPHIGLHNEGAIILLGSAAGLRGCLGAIAYGVAKGALPQFARNLARELACQGIRVNCVSPGIIRTPFQSFLTAEQTANNIENRIPLRREGHADDVANFIVSLVENDFITGENFVIDGGMSMRIV
jgi:NAD(P)-dependent dehydrogenase (short-subunit alcohol dehydrogenase family)